MAWLMFFILTAVCMIMLARGLMVRSHYFHFPFLAAGAVLVFILPQVPGLIANHTVPDDATSKTLFFAILCLVMSSIGWSVSQSGGKGPSISFSERRLLYAALLLSLAGAYFYYRFGQLPDEQRLRGMLTGSAVAYLFFAKLLTYGLAIALLCFIHRPSRFALMIIAFDSLFVFERIFIAGRRGEAAEFLFLIALALWFQKRWAVPRTAVAAGLAISLVSLLVAEEYRQATHYSEAPDWSAVAEIDIGRNWERLLKEGGPEMRNAIMAIDSIDRRKTFSLGVSDWNVLVFTFVPAQLVGNSVKNSLLIPTPELFERGYDPMIGSTLTGFTDPFSAFWYFGCLKFFVIALALGWIYKAAMHGSTIMQILYMLSAMPSILVVTHFTSEIMIAWVHIAAFLVPVLVYSAVTRRRFPDYLADRSRSSGHDNQEPETAMSRLTPVGP